jgi:hypothetical protein
VVALLAAPVVGFGTFAVRSGRTVIRAGQYPPPGMRVLRRTKILRGSTARLTGQGQLVLGLLLVLCGIALFGVACWGAWLIGFAGPTRGAWSADAAAEDLVAAQAVAVAPAPNSSAAIILLEASAEQIDSARTGTSADDFAVIADDLMFYRAAAHERLDSLGPRSIRISGRRSLELVVGGTPRVYDFADAPTLDLIVVYLPDREPRTFPTLEVERALDYFREGAPE